MASKPKFKSGRAQLSESGAIQIMARSEDGLTFTGSADGDFQLQTIHRVIETLWLPASKTAKQREALINQALAALEGLAPRNEAEGMLAANMIATYNAATECFRRAMMPDQSLEAWDKNLKHAVRLTKAYTNQLAALDKHRGRGQQKITVEHVTVEAGGQAIVGSVEAGTRRSDRSRSSGAALAEPGMFDNDDLDRQGDAGSDAPRAIGYQPPQVMEPIKPADDDEAKQHRAKVKRRTRTQKTD